MLKTAKSLWPDVTTIMGGAYVTLDPDRAITNGFVDYAFRGEGELSFPVFLNELQKERPDWSLVKGLVYRSKDGTIVKNEMERERNLDRINPPDYDAINLEGYIRAGYRDHATHKRNAPIWATRGCPYRCAFCPAPQLNGKLLRAHSIGYMVRLVKRLYHEKGIR